MLMLCYIYHSLFVAKEDYGYFCVISFDLKISMDQKIWIQSIKRSLFNVSDFVAFPDPV